MMEKMRKYSFNKNQKKKELFHQFTSGGDRTHDLWIRSPTR